MVELCIDRQPDLLAGKNVILRRFPADGDDEEFFNFVENNVGSWRAETRIERIGSAVWAPKKAWTRAARCIAVLEQVGTAEAMQVLRQLAAGHPDAFPTKAAVNSIIRLKKAQKAASSGLQQSGK